MKRKTHHGALLLGTLFIAAAGCSDDPNAPVKIVGEGMVDGIQTNLTDPQDVVRAHGEALSEMSFHAYEALLDPEFRFYIFDGDAIDFPWLNEDWWPLEVESAMIDNMTDPEFSGDEDPVESIAATAR